MGDFPDPVDRTLHIHCRGQGSIPGLGTRSSHDTTKEPTCLKEDGRACMPQLRPSAAKHIINIRRKIKKHSLKDSPTAINGGLRCTQAVASELSGSGPSGFRAPATPQQRPPPPQHAHTTQ